MNDQLTGKPSLTRKVTDTALVIVAVAAIASWLWRRIRRSTSQELVTSDSTAVIDDKVGASVGFPSAP